MFITLFASGREIDLTVQGKTVELLYGNHALLKTRVKLTTQSGR